MEQRESLKMEMLASLCLMNDGEEGRHLFSFLTPEKENYFKNLPDSFDPSRVQRFNPLRSFSAFQEIHPGWILEKLEGESLRVLGLVCRFLPGDKVRTLLEFLPQKERSQLPLIKESYRVSPQIVEIVRECVEKKWAFYSLSKPEESFSLPHCVRMKMEDLRTLFHDLGFEEIRRAFTDVSPEILRVFLSRFSAADARHIRERLDKKQFVSRQEREESQRHILKLPLEHVPALCLFVFIGYSVFARGLLPTDHLWADLIYQKLPPEAGHRLKRVMQETEPDSLEVVQKRQEKILARIYRLASQGLIQSYWKITPFPLQEAV